MLEQAARVGEETAGASESVESLLVDGLGATRVDTQSKDAEDWGDDSCANESWSERG